jgi:hypothetical protein
MKVSGKLHAPLDLPPGKEPPDTQWIGGWVGLRAGLDDVEKRKFLTLSGLELRPLGRSARSQSLYRLSSPSSFICRYTTDNLLIFILKFRAEGWDKNLSVWQLPM